MNKVNLTIFSNFFIDNNERYQRMVDSFNSFKNYYPEEWIINIRGRFKYKAGEFLKKELDTKLNLFYLESRRGWINDSRFIVKNIKSEFVFYWVEDHILISTIKDLQNSIIEMKKFKADQLLYSFYTKNIIERYSIVKPDKVGKFITTTILDKENCKKIRDKLNSDYYYTYCPSIMTKNFFLEVLNSNKPYLKRWPRHLPFDFEKKSKDYLKPIIINSLPNRELFVSIDDDRGEGGYSLISRGLYPNRISRNKLLIDEYEFMSDKHNIKNRLKKFTYLRIIYIFLKRIIYTINVFFNK